METAFRIQKTQSPVPPDLASHRGGVRAVHILVCLLAHVLWKTLGLWCHAAGPGEEPRQVFAELRQIRLVDVVLSARTGIELRKRGVSRSTVSSIR